MISAWSAGSSALLKDGEAPGTTRDRLRAKHQRPRAPLAACAALDLPARGLDALVRASVHHYNDETEVERFVGAVAGSPPLAAKV